MTVATQRPFAQLASERFERLSMTSGNGHERAELLRAGVTLRIVDSICPLDLASYQWELSRLLSGQKISAAVRSIYTVTDEAVHPVAEANLEEPWLSAYKAELASCRQENGLATELLLSAIYEAMRRSNQWAPKVARSASKNLLCNLWALCWLEAHAPVLQNSGEVHWHFVELTDHLLPKLAAG